MPSPIIKKILAGLVALPIYLGLLAVGVCLLVGYFIAETVAWSIENTSSGEYHKWGTNLVP